tara:strand:+ start:3397 stop:4263 length:867 start_codon:yes stop_codon:yes gene_type:complete
MKVCFIQSGHREEYHLNIAKQLGFSNFVRFPQHLNFLQKLRLLFYLFLYGFLRFEILTFPVSSHLARVFIYTMFAKRVIFLDDDFGVFAYIRSLRFARINKRTGFMFKFLKEQKIVFIIDEKFFSFFNECVSLQRWVSFKSINRQNIRKITKRSKRTWIFLPKFKTFKTASGFLEDILIESGKRHAIPHSSYCYHPSDKQYNVRLVGKSNNLVPIDFTALKNMECVTAPSSNLLFFLASCEELTRKILIILPKIKSRKHRNGDYQFLFTLLRSRLGKEFEAATTTLKV